MANDSPTDDGQAARKAPRKAEAAGSGRGRSSKADILEKAIGLLGDGGYGALSISAVCKAAGVAPTSIYWRFGDKAGLMAAMVKYALRREFDDFMAAFEELRTQHTLIDAYIRVLRSQIVSERPTCWAVISMLAEGRREAPEVAALVNEARRKQIEFARNWGEWVAEAKEPEAFADFIVSQNTFIANVWMQSRDEAEVDRLLGSMRVMMAMMAEKMMARVVDDEAYRRCMAAWGYAPTLERSETRPPSGRGSDAER